MDKVSKKADKNADDIATKAEKTELDKVSKKADKNADDIATKADKANVYTKTESDSRFVKVESSIGGLDTTTKGLDTRLTSAEKSVADHGTRLASAEKSITEHGTRLNGLDKAVSDLRKETRQGLAEQAALSGLFQPYNVGRFNVTAAVGGYKSESAVAIGTGFRFTENFAAKAGVAVGTSSGSSAAYHVGVNYEW
ncbi:TPA: YadA-like family protein [Neisseria meningitidis]